MRGGALPPALLNAAIGLALAFTPRRAWLPSCVSLIATTLVTRTLPIPHACLDGVFLAGWLSTAITAATVHLPRKLAAGAAVALSMNAGLWGGAEIAVAGSRLDLFKALPWVLLTPVAAFLVDCRASITVKVVASWLIAVAILAATLQILPVTPGYLPDHMD